MSNERNINNNAKAVVSALIRVGLSPQEIDETLVCAQMLACSKETLRAIAAEHEARECAVAAPVHCHHVHDGRIKSLIRAIDAIESVARG